MDTSISYACGQLVMANRVLAREGVIDDFGHVSVRHPSDPQRFFLSRSLSPELVTLDDLMEFTLEGEPIARNGRAMYRERVVHGAVYQARPDVMSVTHHHARAVLPFSTSHTPLRPVFHMGAVLGERTPVWDLATEFGDTDMLIETAEQGRAMAAAMGSAPGVLIRGHGATCAGASVREAVFVSIYMKENAELQLSMVPLGEARFLTPGEIRKTRDMRLSDFCQERSWAYRVARAGFTGLR